MKRYVLLTISTLLVLAVMIAAVQKHIHADDEPAQSEVETVESVIEETETEAEECGLIFSAEITKLPEIGEEGGYIADVLSLFDENGDCTDSVLHIYDAAFEPFLSVFCYEEDGHIFEAVENAQTGYLTVYEFEVIDARLAACGTVSVSYDDEAAVENYRKKAVSDQKTDTEDTVEEPEEAAMPEENSAEEDTEASETEVSEVNASETSDEATDATMDSTDETVDIASEKTVETEAGADISASEETSETASTEFAETTKD